MWYKKRKKVFCDEMFEFIKRKYGKNKILCNCSCEEMAEAVEQKTVMYMKAVALFLILLV